MGWKIFLKRKESKSLTNLSCIDYITGDLQYLGSETAIRVMRLTPYILGKYLHYILVSYFVPILLNYCCRLLLLDRKHAVNVVFCKESLFS